jgi:cytochrome c-type biogenesis protein CcmH/NrfG
MKPPVGKTFVVAATLLGLAAVAQLVAILIYFGPGFQQATTAAVAPPPAEPAPAPAEPAAAAPEGPGEEEVQQVNARVTELLAEAERLEGGPTAGDALVPLEEAATLQPRNPEVLSRLGSLHERLGQTELAGTAWENLIALGPDAGRFLDVAEIRLRVLRQGADAEPVAEGTLQLRDQVGLQPGSNLGVVDL